MSSENGSTKLKSLIKKGGGIAVLILAFHIAIFILGGYFPASPVGAEVHILATSTFASAILTFVLIVLYEEIKDIQAEQTGILEDQNEIQSDQTEILEDQNTIQSNQTEILEKQKELTEFQNQPRLTINEWGSGIIPEGVPLFGPLTQEQLYFDLENVGSGAVYNLTVSLFVQPLDDVDELDISDAEELVQNAPPTSTLRQSSKGPHTDPNNHLESGESKRFFANSFYSNNGKVLDAVGTIFGLESPDIIYVAVKISFVDEFKNEESIIPLSVVFHTSKLNSLDDILSEKYEKWINIENSGVSPPSNFVENIDYEYPEPVIPHKQSESD